MATALREVSAMDQSELFDVPSMVEVGRGVEVDAPELAKIAKALIGDQAREIRFLWRNSQAGDQDDPRLYRVGLVPRRYQETYGAKWWVWVAAPWVTALEMTDREVEALIFHACAYCVEEEDTGRPTLRKPPIGAFPEELKRYGAWSAALKRASRSLAAFQGQLPGFGDDGGEDDD